jgi:hypothetical protein
VSGAATPVRSPQPWGRAMTDAAPLITVIGVMLLALAIDVGVLGFALGCGRRFAKLTQHVPSLDGLRQRAQPEAARMASSLHHPIRPP